jgi:ATP-dependent Clp protease, protease subunit
MPTGRTLRVPYNIPGSQNWQWVNIYTRLSQERILFIDQPITSGLANSIVAALLYLDSDDQTKPISLYINSMGDPVEAGVASVEAGMVSVMAGLAIYDTMQHIKSEIVTICMGQAIGMAALLLSAGAKGKRVSLPHTMLALTHPPSGTQGQATDIQVNAAETIAKRNLVHEIFAKHTGQSAEKIAADMNRTFYMTPQEALDYGLVDRVSEGTKRPTAAAASII